MVVEWAYLTIIHVFLGHSQRQPRPTPQPLPRPRGDNGDMERPEPPPAAAKPMLVRYNDEGGVGTRREPPPRPPRAQADWWLMDGHNHRKEGKWRDKSKVDKERVRNSLKHVLLKDQVCTNFFSVFALGCMQCFFPVVWMNLHASKSKSIYITSVWGYIVTVILMATMLWFTGGVTVHDMFTIRNHFVI